MSEQPITLAESKAIYDRIVSEVASKKVALRKAGKPFEQVDAWAECRELIAATAHDIYRMTLKAASSENQSAVLQYAKQIEACKALHAEATAKLPALESGLGIA